MPTLGSHDPNERGRQHSTVASGRAAQLRPLPILIGSVACRGKPLPFRLESGSCILGAGESADVIIDSDTVSRQHAELRLVPEGVSITDLGSKNGCFYLGQRFQSMCLQPGSRFRLGSAEIQIDVDPEALTSSSPGDAERYGELSGMSPVMRRLFAQLVRLQGSQVNLLIRGESGTGKELIARAVHEHSALRDGPFVVVNCGALDRQLVRSELFGHQRGAFTGAVRRHVGAFEAAEGGTLFLDEVGELSPDVQPVLLRVLEQRSITPLGSHDELPVRVRVIAATHRDLGARVQSGEFREDLFYRIQVVRLEVPPLRDRLEDVPVLANAFARRQGLPQLPEDVTQALQHHHWPGNVRELRNAVEAYLALGVMPATQDSGARPGLEAALAQFVNPEQTYAAQKEELLQHFTRAYLERLLRVTGGNQSQAARRSGLERSYLGKLIGKLGLRRE
ncbi:MAG TPA: sigma 54-interacting transcriptional regulator [Polyangiaceae bacterium]|nr:sigma 54-interacting transcriptional regulator [Polyangiaceae bacterium]